MGQTHTGAHEGLFPVCGTLWSREECGEKGTSETMCDELTAARFLISLCYWDGEVDKLGVKLSLEKGRCGGRCFLCSFIFVTINLSLVVIK